MKITLLLFIIGVLLITAGYAQQMKPSCEKGIEVKSGTDITSPQYVWVCLKS